MFELLQFFHLFHIFLEFFFLSSSLFCCWWCRCWWLSLMVGVSIQFYSSSQCLFILVLTILTFSRCTFRLCQPNRRTFGGKTICRQVIWWLRLLLLFQWDFVQRENIIIFMCMRVRCACACVYVKRKKAVDRKLLLCSTFMTAHTHTYTVYTPKKSVWK